MPIPAVSVVMPCFNAGATIRVAIESVLSQTFADFELLIVDDGSADDSAFIARAMAAKDVRIRVLDQINAGPAAARNLGIAKTRGEILAFLDADDRWESSLLSCHVGHLRADESCGISFARIRFFDPSLTRGGRVSAFVKRLNLAHVLGENPICTTSNLVARRSVFTEVGGFDQGLTHGEDQEWVARVLATTRWRVCGLSQILVDYRTSPAGLSADLDRMSAGWAAMFARVRSYAPKAAEQAEGQASALFFRYLARRALRTGQASAVWQPMLRAWRTSPLTLMTHQPHRTFMTMAGALIALLPGNPARALLAR